MCEDEDMEPIKVPKIKPKMNEINFPSLGGDGEVYEPPEVKASKKLNKK